jgi:tetratricopeptide (TPR) repeat protein
LIVLGNRAIVHIQEGEISSSIHAQEVIHTLLYQKGGSSMKRILLMIILFLSLLVCLTSLGWAGGLDDINAGFEAAVAGDYDKAIGLYTKAIESGELSQADLKRAYDHRAFAWEEKGDYAKAIADYTKVIEIDPKDVAAYNVRGFAWLERGDCDRAIADFTKAIEIDPQYSYAYNNRGIAWKCKGDYDRAIADYIKAIEIDPKDTSPYNNRGDAWAYKGDYDKAIADYDKAIEINPNDAFVYNNRGDILYYQAKFQEAIADYKKAIESNYRPNDYPYLNLLRTVSKVSQEEDYNGYLREFREYVTSQKTEDWIRIVSRYYLGMDQLTEGDVLAEARKAKDHREKKERLCEAYYYLGEKRFAQGDRKGAEKLFRKSIKTKIHYFPQYLSSKAVLKLMGEGR